MSSEKPTRAAGDHPTADHFKGGKIRRAKPANAPAMAACAAAAHQTYISRIGRPPGPMLEDYEQVVHQGTAFVVLDEKKVIGLLVLKFSPERALLNNVAVLPEYQGSGWGRSLINLAEAEAIKLGYARLELYTNELMIENIKLYSRLGYVETHRTVEKGYIRVYMGKQLRTGRDQTGKGARVPISEPSRG